MPTAKSMDAALDAAGRPARGTAVEWLVERIQEMIAERGLAFGDPLPTERELGALFGASRNTVREALQYLKAYGIVEIRPKAGAVLANRQNHALVRLMTLHHQISPASFLEVQGFRKIIEVGAGEVIMARVTESELLALEETNRRILGSRDAEDAALNDFAFHEHLLSLAGNGVLSQSFRHQRNAILDIMRLGKERGQVTEATFQAHQEIIDALRARDRIAYAYHISRHLEFGMRFIGEVERTESNRHGAV